MFDDTRVKSMAIVRDFLLHNPDSKPILLTWIVNVTVPLLDHTPYLLLYFNYLFTFYRHNNKCE